MIESRCEAPLICINGRITHLHACVQLESRSRRLIRVKPPLAPCAMLNPARRAGGRILRDRRA
ncbi:hypothetical protein WI41_21340 [Burkholderia latens]|uniref:Uncharacterized protein n=1 Tax=Burkholderia latens TaxID=488446 RepID=A0AAP1C482_9BURK|nr:hypothetical protein WI41_21340 [Burkholderia latens]